MKPFKRSVPFNRLRKNRTKNPNKLVIDEVIKTHIKNKTIFSKLNSKEISEVNKFIRKNHRFLEDKNIIDSLLFKIENFKNSLNNLNKEQKIKQIDTFFKTLNSNEKEYITSHLKIFNYGQSLKESNIIRNGYTNLISSLKSEAIIKLFKDINNYFRM